MSRITWALGLIVALAALPLPQALASETEVDVAYVRPGVDYTRFDKFLIKPLDIAHTLLVPPPWVEGEAGNPRPWKISKKNAEFLQDQYYGVMKAELQDKGGYQLTDKPGSDTLEVEIEIVSLTPYARPNQQVITKGSGEMTIRAEIRDSRSADLLVIYEGDVKVGEDYQENTQFNVDQNVDQVFRSWGKHLREALSEAKGE